MLVALSVMSIISYLSGIVTRGRTSMLLAKIAYKHKHTLTLSFSLCEVPFSIAPALLSEQEKWLGYGAWLLSWLFPASTFLTDYAGLDSEDLHHVITEGFYEGAWPICLLATGYTTSLEDPGK